MQIAASKVVVKERLDEEYVQMDAMPWAPFPDAFSKGGIRWKFLHASPEVGAWTAIFDCPPGSSFASHIHIGPGEYFLTKGKMDVRGGIAAGGDTAVAPGYGYETANARHDQTSFPVPSEFYMTFLGPLVFITPEGAPIAVIGWEEAQGAWNAFLQSSKAA
jgi:hypothetical protein